MWAWRKQQPLCTDAYQHAAGLRERPGAHLLCAALPACTGIYTHTHKRVQLSLTLSNSYSHSVNHFFHVAPLPHCAPPPLAPPPHHTHTHTLSLCMHGQVHLCPGLTLPPLPPPHTLCMHVWPGALLLHTAVPACVCRPGSSRGPRHLLSGAGDDAA